MSTPPSGPEMSLQDVLGFLDLTDELGVRVWLDGGWAVDAHLGEQTRPHADLDIVIEKRDTPTLVSALRQRGYGDVPRDDTRPENFVLGDASGHEIDFHVSCWTTKATGSTAHRRTASCSLPLRCQARASSATARCLAPHRPALSGTGVVGNRTVPCTTPSWLVQSHTGYAVDDDDWADVSALCRRFDLPIPVDYSDFMADP